MLARHSGSKEPVFPLVVVRSVCMKEEAYTRRPWFAVGETARLKGDGINNFSITPCIVRKVYPTRRSSMYEVEEILNGITVIRRVSQNRLLKSLPLYHKSFNEMVSSLKAGAANK
jgi:hypothetical protein